MSNFILYTYQHTCKKGQPAYILKEAPFKSLIKKNEFGKISMPFLGEGFYLWEENLQAARRWGFKHYQNDYDIVEYSDLQINKDDLLDFLDRRSLKYFKELREIFIAKRPESVKWKIGVWIEFLKKLNLTDSGKFPFIYFRADENLPDLQENYRIKEKLNFVDGLDYYTYLSPLFIICLLDKKSINCASRKLKT